MVESISTESPAEPSGGLDVRFCEVMDGAPVMIWVSGRDRLCVWFNRPWLTFTGRSAAQERGNGWTEGVHPEDVDRCLETYISHFDARKEFRMQYRLRRYDGAYRWIDDAGIPRYAPDGTFLGYIGSGTDIHEHRETQTELHKRLLEVLHLNRSATTAVMSSAIAHELNQPLAAILANARAAELLLTVNPIDLDQLKEMLADICQADQRAAEVIRHLRSMLKRRSEIELRELDLNEAIENTLHILGPEARRRGVALSADRRHGALPVLGDQIYLEQVILNLAMNGIEAMQSSPAGERRMTFQSTLVEKSGVEVSVSDSGTGIPDSKLQDIFEPFYTTKEQGTGLGLSISRTIIETFGGKIWAENRPGGGAVFRFSLPLANMHPA